MIQAYSDITQKALKLSSSDRATLAQLLIQSLDSQSDEAVADAWRKEIKRRSELAADGEISERSSKKSIQDRKARIAE